MGKQQKVVYFDAWHCDNVISFVKMVNRNDAKKFFIEFCEKYYSEITGKKLDNKLTNEDIICRVYDLEKNGQQMAFRLKNDKNFIALGDNYTGFLMYDEKVYNIFENSWLKFLLDTYKEQYYDSYIRYWQEYKKDDGTNDVKKCEKISNYRMKLIENIKEQNYDELSN